MTRRWHIDEHPTSVQIAEIVRLLRAGNVALLPTDTIYGLHAAALDETAVERIVDMKGRDEAKPFVVLAASLTQLDELGVSAKPEILEALGSIWPAPLTAILPLRAPIAASRGASTLAIRIPALDWLRQLVLQTGPLVSTSANRSGEPPVTHPSALAHDLQIRLGAVVDAGELGGKPSAILDLSTTEPRFIREGEDSFTQKVWKSLRKTL